MSQEEALHRRSFLRLMALGVAGLAIPSAPLEFDLSKRAVVLPGMVGDYPRLQMADMANSVLRMVCARMDPDRFKTPVRAGEFNHIFSVTTSPSIDDLSSHRALPYEMFEDRYLIPVAHALAKAIDVHNFKSFGDLGIPNMVESGATATDLNRNISLRAVSEYDWAIRRQVVVFSILGS